MIKIVCCALLLLICIGGFFWFLVNVVFLSVGSKNDEKEEPKTPPSEYGGLAIVLIGELLKSIV